MLNKIGIRYPNPKRDRGPDIPKYRLFNFFVNLADKLVGDDQIKTILAGLGQNLGKILSGEILKLVDVEEKIFSLIHWHILAAHSGH